MRYNSHGQVAKNFAGAAIATWLETQGSTGDARSGLVEREHR